MVAELATGPERFTKLGSTHRAVFPTVLHAGITSQGRYYEEVTSLRTQVSWSELKLIPLKRNDRKFGIYPYYNCDTGMDTDDDLVFVSNTLE